MKKVVICNIPLKEKVDAVQYPKNDNKNLNVGKEVVFPINALLSNISKADEEIEIILLAKETQDKFVDNNISIFKSELVSLGVKSKIDYKLIVTPFIEDKKTNDYLLEKIVNSVEDNSEIYCDVTYGPKSLPIIMFAALRFLEKNCGCDVQNIVYGKVDFSKDGLKNPEICDLMSLYYLNSINEKMNFESSKQAKESLHLLLNI